MSIFDIFKKREEEHVASELTDAIKALKKNEIVMIPKVGKRLAKASESKIGGEPYLPADFVWPTYTDSENVTRPLSFFCQIHISDVKKYDKDGLLPERGMLYFFYECESFSWGYDPEDRGAAQLMGINVNAIITLTFAIGSALAACASVFYLMQIPATSPTLGSMPGIKAFTAAVIGGIGSIPGAMLGGVLLGVIEKICLSVPALAPYTTAIEFSLLILILLVKPTGLLGKKRREKV